jgi:transketolase
VLVINPKNAKIWSVLGHRGTFALAMLELAQIDSSLMVLTADLGALTGLDRFKAKHPEKFLNVGIAEQNMVGIAAGLAKEGHTVFATTYSNFLAMRSYEQVRVNLGYMGFPVNLVGTGSGIAMGFSGNTHYGLEDIALMRAVPGLTVLSPADGAEIIKTLMAVKDYPRPTYTRLTGTMNNPIVYTQDYDFQIGRSVTLRSGSDVTIFATGTMVYESLVAAGLLEQQGISAGVVNMHTIKPLDTEAINAACQTSSLIVTVEEHGVVGGLGGAVAECKSCIAGAPRQLFLGLPDKFGKIADYQYQLNKYRLKGLAISEDIRKALRSK